MLSEQDRELADQRAVDEREAGINAVRDIVRQEAWLAPGKPGNKKCIECDELISPTRLKAAPFAQRCINCQTAKENNG